jgi:folate-binding protein YgfZ
METTAAVDALMSGRAFADLSSWRKVAVSGGEALEWLNDLASADISALGPGRARRSLLLSPTGRIRAEFTVAVPGGNLILIQDPAQRTAIDALLEPYVLSSDVQLEDRTGDLAIYAFPGRSASPDSPRTAVSTPSCTGAGADLIALAEDHDFLLSTLSNSYTLAGSEALEAWRIAAGIPRFGVDALEEDLPQEGGFADAVSFEKGCYLGQEAMAKVRNLGHPRRIVVHLAAGDAVSAGDAVESSGERVGKVTSAAASDGHWRLLAKVNWKARGDALRTAGGVRLDPVPHP